MNEYEVTFLLTENAPAWGAVKTIRTRKDDAQAAVNYARETFGATITVTTVKRLEQLFGEWS